MATASPTPAPPGPVRRTSQRQALRRPNSRPALSRSEGQPAPATGAAAPSQQQQQQQQYHDESSEDEIPVEISAFTKALLKNGAPAHSERARAPAPSPPRTRRQANAMNTSMSSVADERRHLRSGSVQAHDTGRSSRHASPSLSREPSPARKRVVRLSNTPQSLSQMKPGVKRASSASLAAGRQQSASRPANRERSAERNPPESHSGVNTPAQGERVVRIAVGSSGNRSRIGRSFSSGPNHDRSAVDRSGLEADAEQPEDPELNARSGAPSSGSVSRYPSTTTKTRLEENPHSSMRVKRNGKIVSKMTGSFLSGPARRVRRRQSEEDEEVNGDGEPLVSSQEREPQSAEDPPASSFYADGMHDFNSGSPVGGNAAARAIHRRHASNADLQTASVAPSPKGLDLPPEPAIPKQMQPKPSAARLQLPSTHDQENEVPVSWKRPKSAVEAVLDKKPNRPLSVDVGQPAIASPGRKPLASIAQNTPHRPAPLPPPKMSVLEAATSTAGAATTTQAKQRRNILKVNGKCYTRLDCLGRGGSAKVYRVSAENGKMFALKRVALENADEITIRGYRGEIDLLSKLSSVDRVINLFDYEMNSEKQVLTLLMEMGELDLNKLIKARQNPESATFDPVFVRFYWKEMLECLQSVHQYDIVHSDLKPANFVLVQGKLKLIDFGIANAIQTDETVNVHSENHQGTPNYMSPESLIDANNPRGGGRVLGRPKLMKVGKPSDVWSLGCVLYQLVYGLPPFGHIVNQMARFQAILNWEHAIDFPSRGMGGAAVPPSLLRTMRRCLNREPHLRPTCEELLHDTDPFLYPSELAERALPIDEELLARIIQSVVSRCRERMPTEAESMSVWPQAYWSSVRKAMVGRM